MADAPTGQNKRLEIRKYPNRRYYDTTRSRHLTLQDIHTLIRDGYDVRVVDSRTNADITAQVLTQVILELETAKLDFFPIPVLMRLIRLNDRFVRDFFGGALGALLDQQQELEERFRQASHVPPGLPLFSAWSKALFSPFTSGAETAKGAPARESQTPNTPPRGPAEVLGELQREVALLKEQLAKRRPKRKIPRR